MDFLGLYDELSDVSMMLEHLKSRQYTRTDIPLSRRDEMSNELADVQEALGKIQDEVKSFIKDEWL